MILDSSGNPLRDVSYREGLGTPGTRSLSHTILQEMGSPLLAMSCDPELLTSSFTLITGTVYGIYVYLPEAATLTGAAWNQRTAGAYTATTTNRIGLYTSDGTTLTQVAATADDGNLWKATSDTTAYKAFSSPYVASAGGYWLLYLYRRSAATVAPIISAPALPALAQMGQMGSADVSMWFTVAGTDLPSTLAWNTTTKVRTPAWIGLY